MLLAGGAGDPDRDGQQRRLALGDGATVDRLADRIDPGPVFAGIAYGRNGTVPLIGAAALSAIAAAFVLGSRELPPDQAASEEIDVVSHVPEEGRPAKRGGLHEALEGLRLVRRNPILLGAISLDLFAVLLGGAVSLLPAIAVRLHVGPVGLGWLRASVGLGAGLMTLMLAFRPVKRRVGIMSNELGGFESGVMGQWLGTTGSVVVGGVGTLVVAVTWALLFSPLRKIDRFPTPPG